MYEEINLIAIAVVSAIVVALFATGLVVIARSLSPDPSVFSKADWRTARPLGRLRMAEDFLSRT